MTFIHDAGFRLWYDDGIHIGAVWRQALADALSNATALIFFSTARSNASPNCLKELNFALDDELPIIVVQLDSTPLPALLRLAIGDRQALQRQTLDTHAYRQKLTDALAEVIPLEDESRQSGTLIPAFHLSTTFPQNDEIAQDYVDDLLEVMSYTSFRIFSEKTEPQIYEKRDFLVALSRRSPEQSIRVKVSAFDGQQLDTWSFPPEAVTDFSYLQPAEIAERLTGIMWSYIAHTEKELDDASLDAMGLIARSRTVYKGLDPRSKSIQLGRERLLAGAIALDPNLMQAHEDMAIFLIYNLEGLFSRDVAGDSARALQHARKAMALNDRGGLKIAATVESTFGDVDQAARLLDRLSRTAIGGDRAVSGVLLRIGRAEEVVSRLTGATNPRELWPLAQAHTVLGQYDLALAVQQELLTHIPDIATANANLANIFGHMGRREEGLAAWQKACAAQSGLNYATWVRGSRVARGHSEKFFRAMVDGLRALGLDDD